MNKKNTHKNEKYIGKQLKEDLFNKAGIHILPSLTMLNKDHMRILESHDLVLEESDVQQPFSGIEHRVIIDDCVLQMAGVFHEIRINKKIPLIDIRQHILPTIHQSTEQPNLFQLFALLQSKDDYMYRHNIGVGVIATLLGRWLGLNENELSQLTISATLHDVGKIRIPIDILNKPEKLSVEEYEMMKKHTIYGYEMMKETVGTNHREALVALQHHERQDGSGYPFGIREDKIDYFSRIVAVADVFHAMSSTRVYRNASPFYDTLKQMQQQAFGVLDGRIVHLFFDKIMQSLVGNEVLLTDGRNGQIIMVNPHDPIRPLVHIGEDTFLDLSKETHIQIEQVI